MNYLYIESDNLITFDGLINNQTGEYINDAIVTATLKDSANVVNTDVQDESLEYVSASNGQYQFVIPEDVSLTHGSFYYLYITAISGELKIVTRMKFQAVYHSEEFS